MERKTYGYQRLGVWDGTVVKLGCDDGCTTINMIKFTKFKKSDIILIRALKEEFTPLLSSRPY